MTDASAPTWEDQVIEAMREFATAYGTVYKKERQIAAHFEIGCLLALIEFYEKAGFVGEVVNMATDGSYRYLTTPNGNPDKFSYMRLRRGEEECIEIRQQVRISSHVGTDISFTPDIVVTPQAATIGKRKDVDYASGKRTFYFVDSKDVIAAHECKSMVPFPELLVSFIGMLMAGHEWIERIDPKDVMTEEGHHLAPCLFVGGSARSLHLRMIKGLKDAYPMNIVVGMHSGTWNLLGDNADIRRMKNPLMVEQGGPGYPPQGAGYSDR